MWIRDSKGESANISHLRRQKSWIPPKELIWGNRGTATEVSVSRNRTCRERKGERSATRFLPAARRNMYQGWNSRVRIFFARASRNKERGSQRAATHVADRFAPPRGIRKDVRRTEHTLQLGLQKLRTLHNRPDQPKQRGCKNLHTPYALQPQKEGKK